MDDAQIKQEFEDSGGEGGGAPQSMAGQINVPQEATKVNNVDPILNFYSKRIKEILLWDEHKIGIEELCARYGYRSEYLIKIGVTNAYVKY